MCINLIPEFSNYLTDDRVRYLSPKLESRTPEPQHQF